MLVFGIGLLALMSGALFFRAGVEVKQATPAPTAAAPAAAAAPVELEAISHPEFTLPDIEGTQRAFSDWQGQNRLINFWATWCAPCRREIPLLRDFQARHAINGFQVIGIAVDYPEEVAAYAEKARFNYPVLIGQQEAMAVAESSGIEFIGMPFTMFVASDGEYVGAYIGELHQEHLDRVVDIMTRLEQSEISKDDARAEFELL